MLKRIALLTDGIFPYVIGGMQKHSYYLAKYFAGKGVEVDLYHFSQSKKYDINKLELFSAEEKKNIKSFVFDFPDSGFLPGHYLRESLAYSEFIFDELKKNMNVDFIYVKGFAGWKLLKEKRKGLKCPPTGVKFHGMNMFEKPWSWRSRVEQQLLRPAAKFNMDNADYIFSYGGKVTDLIREKAGIPSSKIIEIPTGIEASWVKKESCTVNDVRSFLFIGRYDRLKGIDELMKAIIRLSKENNFEFHFVGPIPKETWINSPKVYNHGAITDEKAMQDIMSKCDVLVCPSYSEGMPNVIMEAMSRGLAIVASDVGAVSLMVSANNGWLIASGNTDALEKAMKDVILISSVELKRKKENSIKKVAENFLWKDVIMKTIQKIEEKIMNK